MNNKCSDTNITYILERSLNAPPAPEETLKLLYAAKKDPAAREDLYKTARAVRKASTDDRCYFSGGISGVLPCNLKPLCQYCPYWRGSGKKALEIEDIVRGAAWFHDQGVREFHLSGGTTLGGEGLDVLKIVRAIRDSGLHDMKIVVNCGASMSIETMKKLKSLGVIRIGAVFETLEPIRFSAMKPGDDLSEKIAFAKLTEEAGLELSSGLMAGLGPEQGRPESYAVSLDALRQFPNLTYIYISKFTPDPLIPEKDHPPCSVSEACDLIACARLVLRNITIRAAAGWKGDEHISALRAGAGGDIFALAVNRSADYWGQKKENDNIKFTDMRSEKQIILQKAGLDPL